MHNTACFLVTFFLMINGLSQTVSATWVADNGDGTYKNPVLHADYSDPDAIRVGDDFYMTSSSFEDVPGLPVLHSKDLVNWTLLSHALPVLPPLSTGAPRHGGGVWAPAIRYHNNEYYIYYPDPDAGIYVVRAKNPAGPWSEPMLVEAGKGLIDPCPLWDEDGKVYLVHAFAGSRAGIKSILVIKQLDASGTRVSDKGRLVFDGHATDPTLEGPKLYKRNGWYYIFAPAGGVATGWQLVLRSKNIYGPYERKVVMDQGNSTINGPHQGAWVTIQTGEDWFLHFQDKGAYGRIVHLQPMQWNKDWPVIGIDKDGDGKGEPVNSYRKPNTGKKYNKATPAENDEFNDGTIGLQWQWMGNPSATWSFNNIADGSLRLYAQQTDSAKNLWDRPNILLQKIPAEHFEAVTKLRFTPQTKLLNERAGLIMMGMAYAALYLQQSANGINLVYATCKDADKQGAEQATIIANNIGAVAYLKLSVADGGICRFAYSADGKNYQPVPEAFTAVPGKWKGAKLGIFCVRDSSTNDAGYTDFDWFRLNKAAQADTTSYAQRMARTVLRVWGDSVHLHPGRDFVWTYDRGVILKGFEYLWQDTKDSLWFNTIKKSMDAFVQEDGSIKGYTLEDYNIDYVLCGRNLLTLWLATHEEKYRKAAALLRSQLVHHPRTQQGGFWHKKVYPWQMWLDGLYMGQPFYTQYALLFKEDTVFNDVANQLVWMEQHARDAKTGLLYHGWDESKEQRWADKTTGLSPNFWGRAMGWYGMALVDVLEYFPKNHPRRKEILDILQRFAAAITTAQDKETGLWWDVMDKPHYKNNYLEASASCMLTYTLAKAVLNGWLPQQYKQTANKGYDGILKKFISRDTAGNINLEGTVSVSGLGGRPDAYRDGSFDYYMSEPVIQNDPKGVGAFIKCAAMMERLGYVVK